MQHFSLAVLRFWQYSSTTRLSGRRRTLKTCFAEFPTYYVQIYLFLVNLFFLYVLGIYVSRNGNNLKLKVKSEFSLSMGLTLSRARVIIARKSTGHAFLASFNRNTARKIYPYCQGYNGFWSVVYTSCRLCVNLSWTP